MHMVHEWKVMIHKSGAQPAAETEIAATVLMLLG